MPLSRLEANRILDHFTGKTTWAFVSNRIFVGLTFGAASTASAAGTEPTEGSYARIPIVAANWVTASPSATSTTETNTDRPFGIAAEDWGVGADMTGIVLFDAITAGNYLGFKGLAVNKKVLIGDTAKILSGDLDIAFDEDANP